MHRYVLLVDDEPALLNSLAPFLEDAGHRVVTAGNATVALDLLHANRPDAIVCDLRMPGIGGLEFYRRVQQDPEWESILFVFLTGAVEEADLSRDLDLRGNRILTKPFDPEDLLAVLREDRRPQSRS
jgi:CheY-like chemotaxis protein